VFFLQLSVAVCLPSCVAAVERPLAAQSSRQRRVPFFHLRLRGLYRYSANKTGELLNLFILWVFPVFAKQTSGVAEMPFVFRQRAARDPADLAVCLCCACGWCGAGSIELQ